MARKTSFRAGVEDNPATAFISAPQEERRAPAPPAPVLTGERPETKSVRVNMLFRPTLKKNIEKLATLDRTSLNNLVNDVMEQYVKTRSKDLEKYDEFFKE